jgi:hypothetical protein
MLGMFQTLIAPRYPRRYVGRHRARWAMRRTGPAAAASREMTLTTMWQQTAN